MTKPKNFDSPLDEALEGATTAVPSADTAHDFSDMASTPMPRMPAPQRSLDSVRRAAARASHRSETRSPTGRYVRAGLVDGRYELERLLSKGGMGRVYKARHRDLGRYFALKLVLDGKNRPELRELFVKEARLASSLNHPGIVSVTDFGVDPDLGFFLVMELLNGETLREYLHRNRPRVSVMCDILGQLCSAVRYVHKRGIVHCDIKPENIFIEKLSQDKRERTVKLLDFGLSTRSESPDVQAGGTPPYLAPERVTGSPPSPQCDIYSLGMLFYEMIAGKAPYQGTGAEILQQQMSGPPPQPPSQFAHEPIDARADALILRAISRDPGQRQASADMFQFELRALMHMMGLNPRAPEASGFPGAETPTTAPMSFESPIPIAVFDLAGGERYSNQAFVNLMPLAVQLLQKNAVNELPRRFGDLAVFQKHPELHAAFEEAITSGRPVRSIVFVGIPGEERTAILLLAPNISGGRIESIHATVLGTDADL